MTPLLLLVSLLPLLSAQNKGDLRNYPHCGELGDGGKKECFWECDWQAFPPSLPPPPPYTEDSWPILRRPTSTLCLRGCPSVQYCRNKFLPRYKNISESGDTANLIYRVYLPYFDCLYSPSRPSFMTQFMTQFEESSIGDTVCRLIYWSCMSHFLDPSSDFNCFDEFLDGKKERISLRKRDMRRLRSGILRQIMVNAGENFPIAELYVNNNTLGRYPWLCSLKTRGFNGKHQCAVTLLSAPPATTSVLVSSAHCNYVCRDNKDYILEACCCRKASEPASCRDISPYCGEEAALKLARPEDLQIVCGEWDIGIRSVSYSIEKDLVLNVTGFINHPKFDIDVGPAGGHDIAIYHVDDSQLAAPGALQRRVLWPACLPSMAHKGTQGIVAGWKTPLELFTNYPENQVTEFSRKSSLQTTVAKFRQSNSILRHAAVDNITCADPAWMESDSPYPAGTLCARDRTLQSCFSTGNSGSGLMMERIQGGHSWEGTLSAYKGCDRRRFRKYLGNSFQGENPGIFTQGSCFLPWIASSYGLSLGPGLGKGCNMASGNPEDQNQKTCKARNGQHCLFDTGIVYNITKTGERMFGVGVPGISTNQCTLGGDDRNLYMYYTCLTEVNITSPSDGTWSICANNCRGVRTSDIIAGGAALIIATGTSVLATGPSFGLSLLGLGMTGVAGVGMARMMCMGPIFCRAGAQCCMVIGDSRGGVRCPRSC